MATVLEIREIGEKSEKMDKCLNGQGKVRVFEKERGKSGNSDRLSERKSLNTRQVQLDSSVCQSAVSRGHGKVS